MCNIIGPLKKPRTVTGYKIAIKDEHGNYRSPSTWIIYKNGKIPIVTKDQAEITSHEIRISGFSHITWNWPINMWYDKRHIGHTQIFTKLSDAISISKLGQTILRVSGDGKMTGSFAEGRTRYPTILIDNIIKIEPIPKAQIRAIQNKYRLTRLH